MPKKKAKRARDLRQLQRRRERRNAADGRRESAFPPSQRGPSQSREPPADKLELLRRVDPLADLRRKLGLVAKVKQEWAGIPMPLEGERLVIEPTYPYAAGLSAIGANTEARDPDLAGAERINSWYSESQRMYVHVVRLKDGRITAAVAPAGNGVSKLLSTLGCSAAWGIEQEAKAVELLGTLLGHHAFKCYLLTGTFLESSKRSGVTYMFRRLRPTLAIVPTRDGQNTRMLCALCQHPIAYYEDSWAGAMCPTDDVIAHLMLMRGDEPMLWRRSNQHPASRQEAGVGV